MCLLVQSRMAQQTNQAPNGQVGQPSGPNEYPSGGQQQYAQANRAAAMAKQ